MAVADIVGGIIALGIGVKEWTIEDCRRRLLSLSHDVFGHRSRISQSLDWFTNGWWTVASRLVRIWCNSAIYDADNLEAILRTSFGAEIELMAPRHLGTHVAVTASTAALPACELFTTYNKASHPDGRLYAWHQRLRERYTVKIWEA